MPGQQLTSRVGLEELQRTPLVCFLTKGTFEIPRNRVVERNWLAQNCVGGDFDMTTLLVQTKFHSDTKATS